MIVASFGIRKPDIRLRKLVYGGSANDGKLSVNSKYDWTRVLTEVSDGGKSKDLLRTAGKYASLERSVVRGEFSRPITSSISA